MLLCDLNCDMGEGTGNDQLIMPYVTSANIACGYHAGDENTMRQTILLAQRNNVHIGAHPSFQDRENFGRTEINTSPQQVYDLVSKQIKLLQKIADEFDTRLRHVKPHGALYNMAAKDKLLANAIAKATKECDEHLLLVGLSNSLLISEAKSMGLKTATEVFADRAYCDDGSLVPRIQPGALLEDIREVIQRVLKMVTEGKVKTVSGKEIMVAAETICIHGDGKHAVEFAKEINKALQTI